MRTITTRFVMLVATAAVAPLLLYGAVSVYSLRTGSRQSVIAGNRNVVETLWRWRLAGETPEN